ncbi:MAG: DUF3368 domain-containing protein [Bacteroidetes bacterium]|jgi:predicted nucleic acid-binding protein|nr:DUF3368 domain-containing protein [Bacteroidota bacterium]
MITVSNAGPLIALARIEQLDVLPALYREIVVPSAVHEEVLGTERKGFSELIAADWLQVGAVSDRTAVALLRERLDAGESETIVLALELKADLVLMDEARGRRITAARGITLTGTLGTLILAKRERLVKRVKPLLADLAAQGFHMSDALYRQVLQEAGED